MNRSIEDYKLRQMIKRHGREATFRELGTNQFGEPTGNVAREALVKGIYHETQGFVMATGEDGATTKTKPDAMFLCMEEDASLLKPGMLVTFGAKDYRVTYLRDVENFSLAWDISLELILDDRL